MKRLIPSFAVVLGFAVGSLVSQTIACPGVTPVVTTAVIDCTIQNQGQLVALIGEFQTLLNGQAPDWAAVYQRAKNAGKAIGGCALATVVQDYLGNKSAIPSQDASWTAYGVLDKFRKEELNNATIHTAQYGDL